MKRLLTLTILLLVLVPKVPMAETIELLPGVTVAMELPGEGWALSRQAPDFLLAETEEHLLHELEAEGRPVEAAKVRALAAKRLAANEAFLYNDESGAVLTVDFSPLREGESAPTRRALAASARYAAEGLADEEGVTDLSQRTARAEVAGAEYAYRIDARYRHHGAPVLFTGIVGFASPHWFYLYYTDHLKDPRDAAAIEATLERFVVAPRGGR